MKQQGKILASIAITITVTGQETCQDDIDREDDEDVKEYSKAEEAFEDMTNQV